MARFPTLAALGLSALALTLSCKPAPSAEPEDERARAANDSVADLAAHTQELVALAEASLDDERYLVPVNDADLSFGDPHAPVTVVVFLDYQCEYCRRLDAALRELVAAHPGELRYVVKHLPLNMHEQALEAAVALVAAEAQGRGREMHELLMGATPAEIEDFEALGLRAQVPDLRRFLAETSGPEAEPHVATLRADRELAQRLSLSSTPSYFVNGSFHRGFKDTTELEQLFAAERAKAEELIAGGAAPAEVYSAIMMVAEVERAPAKRPARSSRPRAGRPDPAEAYAVPVDGRPSRGPADAPVTLIEFADFECPYSRKVQATLRELERHYGKELRVVFRQHPLPMHEQAEPAARAALAAEEQGEFWAMHDALFAAAGSEQLAGADSYVDLARELGLDVRRFRADMRSAAVGERLDEDVAVAQQFGARGTPAFFVNGRFLSGSQPRAAFEALIDEELAKAKAYQREHGVEPEALYATMAQGWEPEVEAPPIADHERRTIDLSGLEGKGELDDPELEIVACVDFDCPYSARGAQTMATLLADPKYAGKIGFYLAHFPLPMHEQAEGAHRAAIAAGEQGKLWEMHDLLFADLERRGQAEYEAMASELGLDLARFRRDWAAASTLDAITEGKALCSKQGARGTPAYFINGRMMRGAVPAELVRKVFDEELAGGFEAAE